LIHPQPFSLVGNEAAAAAALISIQTLMCVCVSPAKNNNVYSSILFLRILI
jgi:hypothetical protein